MAPKHPCPTSVMHATVDLHTLQGLPLPVTSWFDKQVHLEERYELESAIFCKVYSALLDDVEAFDLRFESKFSKEIVRIILVYASALGIRNEQFNRRLDSLNHLAQQPDAVEGLSGATVLDYMVCLMVQRSRYGIFRTLDSYQRHLANSNLAKAIREVSNMEQSQGLTQCFHLKSFVRGIGLPKTLFICVGPHPQKPYKHEKGTEENKAERNTNEQDQEEAAEGIYHVVASAPEAFSTSRRKEWADRMQLERMRAVSMHNFRQVCATERLFFTTPGSGHLYENSLSERVRRWILPRHWLAKNYTATVSASETVIPLLTPSITLPTTGPDSRIGAFNHCFEGGGVFDVYAGFQRRARCYKCASVYLYQMDDTSEDAEDDSQGPQWSEDVYNWLSTGSADQGSAENAADEGLLAGSPCAEPLCHLLCSQLM